jgi:hypothetical protein
MKKLSKILGVVVALTMLLSTFAFSTPVAADDEDWSLFTLPDIGAASDYFMDTAITGFGALAQATDGTLYLPVGGVGYADLFISTDDGRTWEETDFFADTAGGPIVDIACYGEDADTVYVADATNVYRTRDAGDSWTDLGTMVAGTEVINCLDIGFADEDPQLFVGTNDPGAGFGDVFYYRDAPFASVWTDLNVCAPDNVGAINSSEVWGIACSPDFESDTLVVAVINLGGNAYVTANEGAGIGATAWDDLELSNTTPAPFAITQATNPVFVEDFNIDDAYGLFVGVVGPAHVASGLGGVYQILGTDDTDDYLLDDVDADIASLDLVGDLDAASLLAGTQVAAGPASIWYSTDNGDSWDETDKPPTGTGATQNLVIVADDFADSGEAWCASRAVTEGGFHLTTDFGATWNGISMIDTNMNLVAAPGAALDIAFTPGYSSDSGTMFAVTVATIAATHSVWSFDGTYWERILLDTANALNLVELSPEFASDNTLFVAASGAPLIFRSDDGGATFTELNREPAAAINSWLVVDDQTILVGEAAGVIEKTTRYGRRAWDDVSPTGAGLITDLAMSPNFATDGTILAGDAASLVFISTDEGDDWDELSASDVAGFATAVNDTYVCFDPNYASNKMVYAASDDNVARCEIAADTDAGDQEFEDFVANAGTPPILGTGAGNGASGIVASKDSATESTLYVLDGVAGCGMWRALDPFQDMGDITFENVVGTIGAAVDFSPNILKVSSIELTSGSNRIWAIDCAVAAADNVWEYTDNLAAPVVLSSPTDGKKLEKTDWVNFQWTALADTVTNYVVEAFTEKDEPTDTAALTGTESVSTWDDINADGIIDPGEITWATVETVGVNTADTASYIWRDAEAGTTYYWRVQVTTPFLSRYSSSWSFMTKVGAPAAPVNVRPEPGASDVILRPTFGWLAIDGATIYKIIVASDPAFANVVASGDSAINVWALPADVADLAYSTTYYWKVWGEAASGAPAGDPVISAFTTEAEPVAPTPAVIVNPTPPAPPAPIITLEIPAAKTPPYVWAIIGIGGVLVIALVVLIARTRRVI